MRFNLVIMFFTSFTKQLAILGEVGLTGEVLPIANLDRYLGAMEVLGVKSAFVQKMNRLATKKGIDPIFVDNIFEAYEIFNTIAFKKERTT